MDDWYDYPQYWEMAFAEDTQPEADFIEAACAKYALRPVRSMLEPACGSGRLVVELARRGYRTTGFDLNLKSIEYARRRIERLKLKANVFPGDMRAFTLPKPVDAAFNTFSTFRLLLSENDALSHLRCVASMLRPGGIYVLGLHLLPPDASEESCERWRAKRGSTEVCYTLRVTATDRRRRIEHLRVTLLVRTPRGKKKYATEFSFRLYTAAQMRRLLAAVPEFELCDVFDYCYDIDDPLKLNNELADVVLILRKKPVEGVAE